MRVGIITVSTRCSAGTAEDLSGPALQALLESGQLFPASVVKLMVVPDEVLRIQMAVRSLTPLCDLLLTTGGTGLSPDDVTPESVGPLLDRPAPGLVAAMLTGSLKITPLAMLSRPVAGVRDSCLVVTLPGSRKGAEECLRLLASGLPHAVDLLAKRQSSVQATHRRLQAPTSQQGQAGRELPVTDSRVHHHHHSHGEHNHHHRHHHDEHHCQSKVDMSRVSERARQSPYPVIPLHEAQKIVLEAVSQHQPTVETVKITEAKGRVLAEDIVARVPLPPFAASVKDGYAVHSADGAGIRRVLGASNAGITEGSGEVVPGSCVRISTGAPVPPGADAVVMVEKTRLVEASEDGTEELSVEILQEPKPGQEIRPVGSDIAVGSRVYAAGHVLGPFELASLVTVGVIQVKVYSRPRVSVLSTGNELQNAGEPLSQGRIYDTNRTLLLSSLSEAGAEVIDAGIAIDEPGVLLSAVRSALARSDVLVTTGGVSMGERDLMKHILTSDLAATVHFGRVFMKPGLPSTFATLTLDGRRKFVFALPGNPVSAAVCSVLHVLPALRKLAGRTQHSNSTLPVQLAEEVRLDPRPEFVRVTLSRSPESTLPLAHTTGNQMSSNVLSLCGAVALLQLPARTEQVTSLPAGAQLEALLLHTTPW